MRGDIHGRVDHASPGSNLHEVRSCLSKTGAYDGAKHYRLNLKPKSPDSFFREATIWMRDRDDIITKLTVLEGTGTPIP